MNEVFSHTDPNGVHAPILATLLSKTTGPILELGVGNNSTPLIHFMCQDRFCLSIDASLDWYSAFVRVFGSRLHCFVHSGDMTVSEKLSALLSYEDFKDVHWGVAFIDHAPAGDRVKCVEILRGRAEYIICHDTEPTVPKEYAWENVFDTFKHKYYWGGLGINGTTVVSENEIPIRTNHIDISIAHSDSARADCIQMPEITMDEFITGDKIADLCDINCEKDYEKDLRKSTKDVLSVFCQTHHLMDVLPRLFKTDKRFVVVSHNSDGSLSERSSGRSTDFLWFYDPKVHHWFSQNMDVRAAGVTPLPIGLENENIFKKEVKQQVMVDLRRANIEKENKMLLCFRRGTSAEQRNSAYDAFGDQPWATCREGENGNGINEYFQEMVRHQFVLSPDGNGLDCLRTWESLYLGCIPVVKRHAFSEYFAKFLPIIVVDNWDEVTLGMLNDRSREMSKRRFQYNMLKMSYWKTEIARRVSIANRNTTRS